MKLFNVTAQVYKNHDPYKQHLLINEIIDGNSQEDAIEKFKVFFSGIEFHLVKIHSAEEISQEVA